MRKIAIKLVPSRTTKGYRTIYEDDIRVVDAGTDIELDRITGKIDILGWVCDENTFGDQCNTDCIHYRKGTCPSEYIRDNNNKLWHLLTSR